MLRAARASAEGTKARARPRPVGDRRLRERYPQVGDIMLHKESPCVIVSTSFRHPGSDSLTCVVRYLGHPHLKDVSRSEKSLYSFHIDDEVDPGDVNADDHKRGMDEARSFVVARGPGVFGSKYRREMPQEYMTTNGIKRKFVVPVDVVDNIPPDGNHQNANNVVLDVAPGVQQLPNDNVHGGNHVDELVNHINDNNGIIVAHHVQQLAIGNVGGDDGNELNNDIVDVNVHAADIYDAVNNLIDNEEFAGLIGDVGDFDSFPKAEEDNMLAIYGEIIANELAQNDTGNLDRLPIVEETEEDVRKKEGKPLNGVPELDVNDVIIAENIEDTRSTDAPDGGDSQSIVAVQVTETHEANGRKNMAGNVHEPVVKLLSLKELAAQGIHNEVDSSVEYQDDDDAPDDNTVTPKCDDEATTGGTKSVKAEEHVDNMAFTTGISNSSNLDGGDANTGTHASKTDVGDGASVDTAGAPLAPTNGDGYIFAIQPATDVNGGDSVVAPAQVAKVNDPIKNGQHRLVIQDVAANAPAAVEEAPAEMSRKRIRQVFNDEEPPAQRPRLDFSGVLNVVKRFWPFS